MRRLGKGASPDDVCEIEILPELEEGLDGIESQKEIIVLFHFDRSDGYDLKLHPRNDESNPLLGVFATRSPRRPNPIGMAQVELLGRKGNRLKVRGLDAFNGTPILDIKPVVRWDQKDIKCK
ncbi:MAG: tRNA (N6-threonylcarbamoyladenosine(37)-N6)-methyltransferase TrmO [Methanomassiliicoccales archaeon]|nr:tRNA (N6-threonylcarbamoyladenosine(37)-N6)-methyltransferase TrmO [Methanomassiliicoccales archaeon]